MLYKDKSKYKSEAYREYMRNYQKSWHQRNRAWRIAKVYERKARLWEFYTQLKATLECAQCGENHSATLQFHHRDPQKKDFNLSEAVCEGYSIERIKREVAKCTVLCANYHVNEHYEWARQSKKPSHEGLAAQFLDVQRELSGNQEADFEHKVENQYVPDDLLASLRQARKGLQDMSNTFQITNELTCAMAQHFQWVNATLILNHARLLQGYQNGRRYYFED
jgi:hypothetical protein